MLFYGGQGQPFAQYNPWKTEAQVISGFNQMNPMNNQQGQDMQVYRTLLNFHGPSGPTQMGQSNVFRTY